MCQSVLQDPGFFALLLHIDQEEVNRIRQLGCPCGGRLNRDDFPRKPRGPFPGGHVWRKRFDLCCARCRHRRMPPSVRFLGRRVYYGFWVVLASALCNGLTGWREAHLAEAVPVPRQTMRRWLLWWTTEFVSTPLWVAMHGAFLPPIAVWRLPASLLERFTAADEPARLLALLRALAPLSTMSEGR